MRSALVICFKTMSAPMRVLLWLLTLPARWSTPPSSSGLPAPEPRLEEPAGPVPVRELSTELGGSQARPRRSPARVMLGGASGRVLVPLVLALLLVAGAYGYFDGLSGSGGSGSGEALVSDNFTGPLDHFVLTPSSGTETAGTPFSLTVTAEDASGQVVTGYTGTVTFTSSDPEAVTPGSYTFVAGDDGQHTFTNGITLNTVGTSETVTVSDGTKTGQASFDVVAGALDQFAVSAAPSTTTAGAPFDVTVTAEDASGNTVTGYTGTVHFTSTDTGAGVVLPGDYTFTASDNGSHTFSGVKLVTAGDQTVTATDTATSSITGSATVDVSAAAAEQLVVASAQSAVTAGSAFGVTVTAVDQFGNTVTGYTGTVHFTSTDTGAGVVLPGDYTFTASDNGSHTFSGVKLVTAGDQMVTATDTATSSITGSATVDVSAAAAEQLVVASAQSAVTAGSAFGVTVTAVDQFGNTVTGYTGTVHFTSTDTGAGVVLPGDYTFTASDNGSHTFSGVKLVTAGDQMVTATDTATSSITGWATVDVSAAAAEQLVVASAQSAVTAGSAFGVTVTAVDQFGNTVTGYTGTVHFTSTDTGAGVVLPGDYTFTASDNGSHTFSGVKLVTAGDQMVTATDTATSSITGWATVDVSAAAAEQLVVASAQSAVTAGSAFGVTVTAVDQFGNTVTGYTGTVHFTSTDTGAGVVLPGDYTFTASDNGSHTFSGVKLVTAGDQTVTATDTATSSITGWATVDVSAAAAEQLVVASAQSAVTAGSAFGVTVTAVDQFGNTVTGYTGTVHFTSTDTGAGVVLPGDYTFTASDNGSHTFSGVKLVTAGDQMVTATDTATSSITGWATVDVSAGVAAKIVLSGGPSVAVGAGEALQATITDQYGNTVTTGADADATVAFTQTGGSGSLSGLASSTASAGVASDSITGLSAGTVDVQASATLSGGSASSNTLAITVTALPAADLNAVAAAPDCSKCAWAVGDGGTILYGEQSSFSAEVSGVTANLNGVAVTDGHGHGYGYGGGRVWAVGDGGTIVECSSNCTSPGAAVWVKQVSNTTANLYAVTAARRGGSVWAVGAGGVIDHWDGTSWTPQTVGSDDLYGIGGSLFGDKLWAVGASGTILESWNGTSWSAQTAPTISGSTSYTLRSVSSYDPNDNDDVWAVGDGGIVIRTVDSGASWTQVSAGVASGILYGVAASPFDPVYAVGADGTILTSSNGSSFTPRTSGTSNDLFGVAENPFGNAWAVGADGTILYSANDGASWSAADYPTIALSPATGIAGTTSIAISGSGFADDHRVTIEVNGAAPATSSCGETTGAGDLPAPCTFTIPANPGCSSCAVAVSDGTSQAVASLVVEIPPAFTSAGSATFVTGSSGSFTVTTSGSPLSGMSITDAAFGSCKPTSLAGSGVVLTSNGDGTATISAGSTATPGTYTLCLNASNGIGSPATQTFTLTVSSFAISGLEFNFGSFTDAWLYAAWQGCSGPTGTTTVVVTCKATDLGFGGVLNGTISFFSGSLLSGTPVANSTGSAITIVPTGSSGGGSAGTATIANGRAVSSTVSISPNGTQTWTYAYTAANGTVYEVVIDA